MKKLIQSLGLISISVLLLSACSEQTVVKENSSPEVQKKVDEASDAVNSSSENEVTESQEEQAEVKAKVGDTLNVNGVKITVTGIEKYEGRINQFQPLKEDHAVKIDVIAENTNTEKELVNSAEFTLYDVDGFELGSALVGDGDVLSGDIPAGKKIKGSVYFDVPQQSGTWELHYEKMFSLSNEAAIWEVEAK